MVICVRMEHLGVLCVCAFQIGEPGEKPLRASREPTTHSTKKKKNKLNSRMASTLGFKPRPHWWEANALPTAPSLLPKNITYKSNDKQQNGFA